MKNIGSLLFLFLGLCLSAHAGAQAGATLLVTTDMGCNWRLDGRPMGLLMVDDPKAVPVSPGEHLIEATTTDGMTTIRTKVEVDQGQKTVDIQLKSQHEQQLEMQRAETARKQAAADAAREPTWTDPATRLTWTRKDNGSDVNWNQAGAYCSNLKLASYNDWRLPTIEELQGIDDPTISSPVVFDNGTRWTVHVKGNLKLTGWHWSSSQGSDPEKPGKVVWHFHFGLERRGDSFPRDFSFSMRALCVRRSGE